MANSYVLTEAIRKRLLSRRGVVKCFGCGEPSRLAMKLSERVRGRSLWPNRAQLYHKECFEELLL